MCKGERREGIMKHSQQVYQGMGLLLCTTLVLMSCTYDTAVNRLSPAEQDELRLYRHVMTSAQVRTYLVQATATARTAYLNETGLLQRFEALDPLDRDAVRSGLPRRGMRAEALQFVWGEPYYTSGRAHNYAHWYYLGSSLGLAAWGNQYSGFGNRVDVYLVDDQVVGWVDFAPVREDASDCIGC